MSRIGARSRSAALIVSLALGAAALLSPILPATSAGAEGVGQDAGTGTGTGDTVAAPIWPACESFTIHQYTPFSVSLDASGATSYTVVSGALPSGVTLEAGAGILSGTTEQAVGVVSITVQAANATGATERVVSIDSLPEQTPTWSSAALAPGVAGAPYSAAPTATFASLYSVVGGTPLPPGLVLHPGTGEITGTPAAPGDYAFTVRATNHEKYADASLDLRILAAGSTAPAPATAPPAPPRWDTTALPSAERGQPYFGTLAAEDAQGFAVTTGALPDGIVLDETTGTLCGIPTTAGSFSFVGTATNSVGSTDQALTLTVLPPAPVWQDSTLADATAGAAYDDGVTASDTQSYAITAGALPAGLALDAKSGAVAGAPLVAGSARFTVTASNAGGSVSHDFTMRVAAAVAASLPPSAPSTPASMPVVTVAAAPAPVQTAPPAATAVSATKPASGGFGGLGLIVMIVAALLGGGLFAGFGGGGGGKSLSGL